MARWRQASSGARLALYLVVVLVMAVVLARAVDGPRTVTEDELVAESGISRERLAPACLEFLAHAAELRSGDLRAGEAEREAAANCQTAIPTAFPFLWPTIEAAGR